jgi:UDP-N-acetylglucosamine 2-epimerase
MLLISFGTRPEWIKIKPIVDEIEGEIPYKILFTGQHTSLVEEYLEDTFILNDIGDGDNRLDSIVCSLLNKDHLFNNVTHVLVQGDTTSAFAVALAAFHRKIPVIHLEAGLRTFDTDNPYPEEFNRTAISALADIHLCPTDTSASNVLSMVGHNSKIYVTGNTVLDNLVGLEPTTSDIVLITMHRRENHARMHEWFKAISFLALENPDLQFVLPLHPNPNVCKHKHLLTDVTVIDPLSYGQCIDLIRTCKTIITDSGGIQEESSFFKKKCIVCRKVTERAEGIGTFAYICKEPPELKPLFDSIISSGEFVVEEECPYGNGHAADKIMKIFRLENI